MVKIANISFFIQYKFSTPLLASIFSKLDFYDIPVENGQWHRHVSNYRPNVTSPVEIGL